MKLITIMVLISTAGWAKSYPAFIKLKKFGQSLQLSFGEEKENLATNSVFNYLSRGKGYSCEGGASGSGNTCSNENFICETFGL